MKYLLLADQEFKKYFGEFFIKNEEQYFETTNDVQIKKVFWVCDTENNDEIVGMVRIYSYHEAGYISIQYAVLPDYRKQGYGKLILKELSEFLLQNKDIRCIEGDIDKTNLGSIKVATSLGFKEENGKYKFRR